MTDYEYEDLIREYRARGWTVEEHADGVTMSRPARPVSVRKRPTYLPWPLRLWKWLQWRLHARRH